MAEKRTIEVEIQDNSKSLKAQYREAVQELQKVSAQYGETSKEAIKAAKAAADLKDQIEFSKDLVGAFNPDAKFNALTKSIGGVLDGFQAFEGALGLVGVEGEAVQETMLKVQSAMALSQGLQGLMEARDSFKQLGTVAVNALNGIRTGIAATGIGLLVIAVGLLVANFDKLKDAFATGLTKAKAFEKGVTEQAQAARDAVNNFSEYERTLRRLGKTEDEIQAKRRERFKKAIEQTQKELEANKKVYQEQVKNLETVKDFDKWGLNATGRLLFGDEEDAKEQRKKITDTKNQLEKLKNDKFEFEQKIKDDAKKKREEDLQDYKDKIKAKQDLIKRDLQNIKENNKAAFESNQARLRTDQENEEYAITSKYEQQIALAKKYGKDTSQLELAQANEINEVRLKYQDLDYKQKEEERQKELEAIKQANEKRIALEDQQFELEQSLNQTQKEKEIADVVKSYEDKFAIANGNAELEKQLTEQQEKDIAVIEDKYRKEKEEKEKQALEKQKQIQQQKVDLILKYAQTFVQAMSSLNGLLNANDEARLKKVKQGSKEEEDIKRRMFKRDKALRIVQTVVDTASNVVQSVRNGGGIPAGIPFGIAAGAMGAMQIAAISKTKFEGGGENQAPSGSNLSGGTQMQAPQFSTIGTSGINQLATLQQQPTKAYVVSGEVTSAQSLDRNRIQNATL